MKKSNKKVKSPKSLKKGPRKVKTLKKFKGGQEPEIDSKNLPTIVVTEPQDKVQDQPQQQQNQQFLTPPPKGYTQSSQAQAKAALQSQSQAKVQAQPQAKVQAQPQTQTKVQAQPQAKVQAKQKEKEERDEYAFTEKKVPLWLEQTLEEYYKMISEDIETTQKLWKKLLNNSKPKKQDFKNVKIYNLIKDYNDVLNLYNSIYYSESKLTRLYVRLDKFENIYKLDTEKIYKNKVNNFNQIVKENIELFIYFMVESINRIKMIVEEYNNYMKRYNKLIGPFTRLKDILKNLDKERDDIRKKAKSEGYKYDT